MRATGWNNGSHSATGAGYGVRFSAEDRARYFLPGWTKAIFDLEDETEVMVKLSPSFWRSCTELRSAEVGRWLLRGRLAPWSRGCPPALDVEHVADNRFRIVVAASRGDGC
jgi:hypothetical protein